MCSEMTIVNQVRMLEERQLNNWPLARKNYAALDDVQTREIVLEHSLIVLQHNPERRRSSAAQVDAASLAARPCFLCREHQPAEQEAVEWGGGRYKIQVNPYPIFPRHLTISAAEHTPQSLADPRRVSDMLSLARDLDDYVVFYNGPKCGASAPDHMHFQAGVKGLMPLCSELMDPVVWPDENLLESNDEGFIGYTQRMDRFLFMIKAEQPALAELYFARLQVAMMQAAGRMEEPMQNVLCWTAGDDYYLVVFPRRKHRPDCYGEGPGKLLLSPASVDMGGLWAVAEESDYHNITTDTVRAIYDELCADNAMAVAMIDHFLWSEKEM